MGSIISTLASLVSVQMESRKLCTKFLCDSFSVGQAAVVLLLSRSSRSALPTSSFSATPPGGGVGRLHEIESPLGVCGLLVQLRKDAEAVGCVAVSDESLGLWRES